MHIAGSINVPFEKVKDTATKENWDKNVSIVTYCSNYACSASGAAAKELKELGFSNVSAYEGGMAEWFELSKKDPSYKVVGSGQEKYLTMPNEKPTEENKEIKVISAEELKKRNG